VFDVGFIHNEVTTIRDRIETVAMIAAINIPL
jgi:hypothetical protein